MRKLHPYHGEKLTINEISRRLGMIRSDGRPSDGFRRRVKRLGYKKALDLAESKKRIDAKYVVFGNTSKPIEGWCDIFRMNETTVFSRLARGWEIHEALSVPPEIKHRTREDSLSAVARRNGLKMQTVWARKHKGWSTENSLKPINHSEIVKSRSESRKVNRERKLINRQLLSLGIIVE